VRAFVSSQASGPDLDVLSAPVHSRSQAEKVDVLGRLGSVKETRMKRSWAERPARVLCVAAVVLCGAASAQLAPADGLAREARLAGTSPVSSLTGFVANEGQWDEQVLFFARQAGIEATLMHDALVLAPARDPRTDAPRPAPLVLRMPAEALALEGVDELPTRYHFLRGAARRGERERRAGLRAGALPLRRAGDRRARAPRGERLRVRPAPRAGGGPLGVRAHRRGRARAGAARGRRARARDGVGPGRAAYRCVVGDRRPGRARGRGERVHAGGAGARRGAPGLRGAGPRPGPRVRARPEPDLLDVHQWVEHRPPECDGRRAGWDDLPDGPGRRGHPHDPGRVRHDVEHAGRLGGQPVAGRLDPRVGDVPRRREHRGPLRRAPRSGR